MAERIPFAEADPRLEAVYAYWQAKRGARPMPARRDIEPLDIRAVPPPLMLVDVEPGPRYRYRLFGTGRDTKMRTRRPMLPLSSDGAAVDKALACQAFVHGPPLQTLTVRLARDKAEPIGNAKARLG